MQLRSRSNEKESKFNNNKTVLKKQPKPVSSFIKFQSEIVPLAKKKLNMNHSEAMKYAGQHWKNMKEEIKSLDMNDNQDKDFSWYLQKLNFNKLKD